MAKILIIDHRECARRALKLMLRVREHQVLEAADEATALEQYFIQRPQLVLLDASLDDMHDFRTLRKIRAIDPTACVLVMTANIHHSTRALARVDGVFGFIVKPFVTEQVVSMVDAALQDSGVASSLTTRAFTTAKH